MKRKFTQKILTLLLSCFCTIAIHADNKSIDDIAGIYTGTLSIDLSAIEGSEPGTLVSVSPDQILLEKEAAENQIKLTLKNFSLGAQPIGDIEIPGINVVQNGEEYSFESDVVKIYLLWGSIEADVKTNGKIQGGNTDITIDVAWVTGGPSSVPIPVTFSGEEVSDGLRLTDIKIDGVSVTDFDSEKFNYIANIATGNEKLSYTKANAGSTVDIALDGKWVYLYVTDGTRKARYTLHALDQEGAATTIKKLAIDQVIDGNLTLTNGAEIEGEVTANGVITYNKPINSDSWNTVGVPYDLSAIKAVMQDGSRIDVTDAHWYTYNAQGDQQKLNSPAPVMIMKLKDNTENVVSLDIVSINNSTVGDDDLNLGGENMYIAVFNPMLRTMPVSYSSQITTYYVFNGNVFEKVDGSTEVPPATMYIAYRGSSPVESIDVPDPSLSGIGHDNSDNLKVYSSDGQVFIRNFNGTAEIYKLDGSKVHTRKVNGDSDFNLSQGIYLIRTGEKATLVSIR